MAEDSPSCQLRARNNEIKLETLSFRFPSQLFSCHLFFLGFIDARPPGFVIPQLGFACAQVMMMNSLSESPAAGDAPSVSQPAGVQDFIVS